MINIQANPHLVDQADDQMGTSQARAQMPQGGIHETLEEQILRVLQNVSPDERRRILMRINMIDGNTY